MTNPDSSLRSVAEAGTRVRSIWLTQLSLGLAVIVVSITAFAYLPEVFTSGLMIAGVFAIVAITAATLFIPWGLLPRWAPVIVPFADIAAIGLMSASTSLSLGFFWVFPIMWIGLHFSAWALALAVAAMGTSLVLESSLSATATSAPTAVELFAGLLGMTFLGVVAHLTMRQTRAFRRLLLGQTRRLETTLERVQNAERRTAELLDAVDVGVLRFSQDGALLTINSTYAHLYGIDPQDSSYAPSAIEFSSLRGEPIPADQRSFARARRGEIFDDERVWLLDVQETWHALSVSTIRLSSLNADYASTVLVVHDITATTEAERERERIAAVASHELRHPLTIILGHTDLALEEIDDLGEGDTLDPAQVREHLEVIQGAGERMIDITSGMLKDSKQGFTPTQDRRIFDIVPVLNAVLDAFTPIAGDHGVALRADLPATLPVTGDVFRIRQVLDNLVSNAIKYTPGGGIVRVSARLEIDEIVISIADTGIGIGSEDLGHVFDPLFRSARAQQQASGTGLGLGITRDIVTAHGGTLNLTSEIGHGTTVTVTLPRAEALE
ncbi:sensor histidine kinase [Microbacterium sediminicola]|uniref:histidine kinase n=1 Tax=Microbacterium sediminicola TaxID=415210 RepID=A0ABP4UP27_9MICO